MTPEEQIARLQEQLARFIEVTRERGYSPEMTQQLIQRATDRTNSEIAQIRSQMTSGAPTQAPGAPVQGEQAPAPQAAPAPPAAPPTAETPPAAPPAATDNVASNEEDARIREQYRLQAEGHRRNPVRVPIPEVPPGYVVGPRGDLIRMAPQENVRFETRQVEREAAQRPELTDKELFTEQRLRPTDDETYFRERDRAIQAELADVTRVQQSRINNGLATKEQAEQAIQDAAIAAAARYDRETQARREQDGIDIPIPEGRPPTVPETTGAPTAGGPRAAGAGAGAGAGAAAPSAPGAAGEGAAPKTLRDIKNEVMQRMQDSVGSENLLRFMAGQEESMFIQEQADDLLRRQNEEAERRQRENDVFRNRLQEFDDRVRNMRQQTLDPNRLFADRALGVSMALGVAAGALQQTMLNILYPGSNPANTALALVNDAVERDIKAQEFNLNRGVTLLDHDVSILAQARDLTNNDRDARQYAIDASKLYGIEMLKSIVARNKPLIEAQPLLRELEAKRLEIETSMEQIEQRARLENARAAARSRGGSGGGGGGRRGEGPMTGARASATAAVDDYNAGRPIPGTTSLYYTRDAVTEWEDEQQTRPRTVKDIKDILGPDADKLLATFGRNEQLLRELLKLRRMYDAPGALSPFGTDAAAALRAQAELVQGELTRAVSGLGASDAERERAATRVPIPTWQGWITRGVGDNVSPDEARAAINQTIQSVQEEMNDVIQRGGKRLARRAPAVRQDREVSMTRGQAQQELRDLEAQEERQAQEEAQERVRRQQAQRGGGGQ
jgi:hypothetical protein